MINDDVRKMCEEVRLLRESQRRLAQRLARLHDDEPEPLRTYGRAYDLTPLVMAETPDRLKQAFLARVEQEIATQHGNRDSIPDRERAAKSALEKWNEEDSESAQSLDSQSFSDCIYKATQSGGLDTRPELRQPAPTGTGPRDVSDGGGQMYGVVPGPTDDQKPGDMARTRGKPVFFDDQASDDDEDDYEEKQPAYGSRDHEHAGIDLAKLKAIAAHHRLDMRRKPHRELARSLYFQKHGRSLKQAKTAEEAVHAVLKKTGAKINMLTEPDAWDAAKADATRIVMRERADLLAGNYGSGAKPARVSMDAITMSEGDAAVKLSEKVAQELGSDPTRFVDMEAAKTRAAQTVARKYPRLIHRSYGKWV
jgi:hypothetical protein